MPLSFDIAFFQVLRPSDNKILLLHQFKIRLLFQNYNEKWVIDSTTGHIKLFADPNKCLTARNDGYLALMKCSNRDCVQCPDRWGNAHLPIHEKVTNALKNPYGDLNLVTWAGLEIGG